MTLIEARKVMQECTTALQELHSSDSPLVAAHRVALDAIDFAIRTNNIQGDEADSV
jgi:hypothetical protein